MRIWFFTDYYSISPSKLSQIPGKGAKYTSRELVGWGAFGRARP